MKNKRIIKIVMSAMFAALVAGLTFFPAIPIPGGGYVHLGDAMIYIAASFLPMPYAMAVAAIGGGLADLLSGFAAYAPFTVIVKALLTIAFTYKNEKILSKRNFLAPLTGLLITPGIYFAADWILYGGIAAAIPGIIWNICQAAASMLVFYIAAAAFDKLQFKKKLFSKLY